jgi:hypothetical protein
LISLVLGNSQANHRGEEITSLVFGFDEKITSEELARIGAVVVVVVVFFFGCWFWSRGEATDWDGQRGEAMGGEGGAAVRRS